MMMMIIMTMMMMMMMMMMMIMMIILLLLQNVKLVGSGTVNRVTTSMTLQPKLGVLLDKPAKVGVQTCP